MGGDFVQPEDLRVMPPEAWQALTELLNECEGLMTFPLQVLFHRMAAISKPDGGRPHHRLAGPGGPPVVEGSRSLGGRLGPRASVPTNMQAPAKTRLMPWR